MSQGAEASQDAKASQGAEVSEGAEVSRGVEVSQGYAKPAPCPCPQWGLWHGRVGNCARRLPAQLEGVTTHT